MVNLSPRQLEQAGLAQVVETALKAARLERQYLGLELTETKMTCDQDTAIKVMSGLRSLGVQLALDNFGAGYSSLTYLKSLPVDTLHINRWYVSDLETNPDCAAIIRASISIAHALGLQVLAEGVETEDQITFLRTHRCDLVQGFLFSPPLPPEEMAGLLREGRRLQ